MILLQSPTAASIPESGSLPSRSPRCLTAKIEACWRIPYPSSLQAQRQSSQAQRIWPISCQVCRTRRPSSRSASANAASHTSRAPQTCAAALNACSLQKARSRAACSCFPSYARSPGHPTAQTSKPRCCFIAKSGMPWKRKTRGKDASAVRKRLRLRPPAYLRMALENDFPRLFATNRYVRSAADRSFGPFPTRAAAERACDAVLDLFQLRRCVEDLHPYPEHPACPYFEMKKCLAPCNQTCTPDRHRAEADAVFEDSPHPWRQPAFILGARASRGIRSSRVRNRLRDPPAIRESRDRSSRVARIGAPALRTLRRHGAAIGPAWRSGTLPAHASGTRWPRRLRHHRHASPQ